jgi:hypothetical protein
MFSCLKKVCIYNITTPISIKYIIHFLIVIIESYRVTKYPTKEVIYYFSNFY